MDRSLVPVRFKIHSSLMAPLDNYVSPLELISCETLRLYQGHSTSVSKGLDTTDEKSLGLRKVLTAI